MSNRKMYLGHVNIYVRDADKARAWYEKVLGLHTYHHRPGTAAFMSADLDQSHEVALMAVGDDAPLQRKGQVGLNHMAWMVDSLDALKTAYQRLKDNDVKIERVVDHGISLGIYFRDPDGNGLEVSYELPRAAWPRQDQVFGLAPDERGRFPGPWDAER
jgi:catechol 2,3-dioxygenase